jgi:hypothetical protein
VAKPPPKVGDDSPLIEGQRAFLTLTATQHQLIGLFRVVRVEELCKSTAKIGRDDKQFLPAALVVEGSAQYSRQRTARYDLIRATVVFSRAEGVYRPEEAEEGALKVGVKVFM